VRFVITFIRNSDSSGLIPHIVFKNCAPEGELSCVRFTPIVDCINLTQSNYFLGEKRHEKEQC
jgi:hypothetical protein